MASGTATDSLVPINIRHRASRKKMLEAFAHEDGHRELSPIVRDAIDFYISERLLRGREAVRLSVAAGR